MDLRSVYMTRCHTCGEFATQKTHPFGCPEADTNAVERELEIADNGTVDGSSEVRSEMDIERDRVLRRELRTAGIELTLEQVGDIMELSRRYTEVELAIWTVEGGRDERPVARA